MTSPARIVTYGILDGKEIAIIPLTRRTVAIIDREDEWKLPGLWCNSHGYARQMAPSRDHLISMQNVIMGHRYDGKFVVDHINGDPLDNRKGNLRIVSHSQNRWNGRNKSNNKSGVSGVRWRKDRKKWEMSITGNGERIIKHFARFEDAVKFRREEEERRYGEYRRRL